LHFGPVFQTIYPLFVVLVMADIVRHTIALLLPGWEKGRFAFSLFFRAMNLLVLYFLINAADLLVAGEVIAPGLQPVLKGLNQMLHLGVIVAAVVTLGQLAWELYRYLFRASDNGRRVVARL